MYVILILIKFRS